MVAPRVSTASTSSSTDTQRAPVVRDLTPPLKHRLASLDTAMGANHVEVYDAAYPFPASPASQADTVINHMPHHTVSTSALDEVANGVPVVARRLPYSEHGALIDRSQTKEENLNPAHPSLALPRIRRALREPLAEFMGVFILIMFGDGVVAQVLLSDDSDGDYQSISWGWGLGVMLGVYTAGISGAHLNPAVTFANCVYRKFPWRKFPIYMLAQVLGAMAAAFVVYGNYKSAIEKYEGGKGVLTVPGYSTTATAGIFCTYPQPFMTKTGQFFSEFVASSLLMFLIYALKDDENLGAGNLTPLGLFFVIFGIGACFGWETGYAINLARDFGPRLVSYILGYGPNVWRAGNYYFWVPMVAPFFGCCFGGFLYDVFLFTGESPINTPYMGLYRFVPGYRNWDWEAELPVEEKDAEKQA